MLKSGSAPAQRPKGLVCIQDLFLSYGRVSNNLSEVLIGRRGALHIKRKQRPERAGSLAGEVLGAAATRQGGGVGGVLA